MKILTLNLWNGGRLFEAARDFLVEQNADIYFLQEVYDGHDPQFEDRFRTVDVLKEIFKDYHAFFGPVYLDTREKEGDIEDGQLILSRWPLIDTENLYPDVPYGRYNQDGTAEDYTKYPVLIQKAGIEVEGKPITLLNVHGPVNYDGLQHDSRRQKMAEVILANLGENSIVAGDFNVRPQSQTIQNFEQKLVSVFGAELPTTFNLQRKNLIKQPGYADSAVDMVFLTKNFQVKNKQQPQADVSDHLPLVVEVE